MTGPVMPLGPDDPEWERKRRVAELHDLLVLSGFSWQVFYLHLRQRYEAPGPEPILRPTRRCRRQ